MRETKKQQNQSATVLLNDALLLSDIEDHLSEIQELVQQVRGTVNVALCFAIAAPDPATTPEPQDITGFLQLIGGRLDMADHQLRGILSLYESKQQRLK